MTAVATAPDVPYKFLDYFHAADAPIFFGRNREIEILLADVIAMRLVVLFARTGTGKSSLIGAGVIPRLNALDYRTVVCRVGRDPEKSIAEALVDIGLLEPGTETSQSLSHTLLSVVEQTKRPIVIFVDQFEEFFLREIPPETRARFVEQAGELCRTPRSGVHLLFSLREDFLAELDMFRDEIPTIFQKESQLRLRPLTDEQARQAIVGPTVVVNPPFAFEDGVVDAIIADLPREGGYIHPVTVQIVCDTLWRGMRDNRITMQDYVRARRATGILEARIVDDVSTFDPATIAALEQLIPLLSSEEGPKLTATRADLLRSGVEVSLLDRALDRLLELRLLRREERGTIQHVEWVSDYVSATMRALAPRLQVIWVEKVRQAPAQRVEIDRIVALLNNKAVAAELRGADWYFLLRSAASSRDTLGLWFSSATQFHQDAWHMLQSVLDDSHLSEEAIQRILLYIGEFKEGIAVEILAAQVKRRGRERTALRALGATQSSLAVEYLETALESPELSGVAIDALQSLGIKDAIDRAEESRKKSKSWKEKLSSVFTSPTVQLAGMPEDQWQEVVAAVSGGQGAVIIGPAIGSHRPVLARQLAKQFSYPFTDSDNFESVLDFLSVEYQGSWSKALSGIGSDLPEPSSVYQSIATLPIPTFFSTDPTDELQVALRAIGRNSLTWTPELSRTGYSGGALIVALQGSIQNPQTVRGLRGRLNAATEALSSVRNSAWPMPSLLIAVGFSAEDQTPEAIRSAVTAGGAGAPYSPSFSLIVRVGPSPTVVDSRAANVAREYCARYRRTNQTILYWGSVETFVKEFMTRQRVT